jgi:hypothetical protein
VELAELLEMLSAKLIPFTKTTKPTPVITQEHLQVHAQTQQVLNYKQHVAIIKHAVMDSAQI